MIFLVPKCRDYVFLLTLQVSESEGGPEAGEGSEPEEDLGAQAPPSSSKRAQMLLLNILSICLDINLPLLNYMLP